MRSRRVELAVVGGVTAAAGLEAEPLVAVVTARDVPLTPPAQRFVALLREGFVS